MLITLAIIGIVAVMTIPTLVAKYQEKVTVTKLKKIYSLLTNAYGLYVTENGSVGHLDYNEEGAVKAYNVFAPYLKVIKDCGTSNDGNCITNEKYKNMDGTERIAYSSSSYYTVGLNDGSTLIFRGGMSNGKIKLEIFCDVNGKEAPNQWGVDLFEFDLENDTLRPNGYASYETGCIAEGANGWTCTSWVIYKGNMDYLKK